MGYQLQIVVSIIMISLSAIGATVGTYMLVGGLADRKKIIEHKENLQMLKPEIIVNLYPNPVEMLTPYNKYPLREYTFMIQNKNKNAADIIDCRIKFSFPNIVAKVISRPLILGGEAVSVTGVRTYKKTKNGIQVYEEQPPKNPIANSFSLEVESAHANGALINTNIALFTCLKWPKNADFSGTLVVDQSKIPQIVKSPDSIGTYSGTYNYIVDGKAYEEKILGKILPITTQSSSSESLVGGSSGH